MRYWTKAANGTGVELTDHDIADEMSYIVNEIRSLKGAVLSIRTELEGIYWQMKQSNKPVIYEEGTTKQIKVVDEK